MTATLGSLRPGQKHCLRSPHSEQGLSSQVCTIHPLLSPPRSYESRSHGEVCNPVNNCLVARQRTMENVVVQGRERFCGHLSLLYPESLGAFIGQSAPTQHRALFLVPLCSFPINQPPVALEIFKLSNFFSGFTTIQKFNNWLWGRKIRVGRSYWKKSDLSHLKHAGRVLALGPLLGPLLHLCCLHSKLSIFQMCWGSILLGITWTVSLDWGLWGVRGPCFGLKHQH